MKNFYAMLKLDITSWQMPHSNMCVSCVQRCRFHIEKSMESLLHGTGTHTQFTVRLKCFAVVNATDRNGDKCFSLYAHCVLSPLFVLAVSLSPSLHLSLFFCQTQKIIYLSPFAFSTLFICMNVISIWTDDGRESTKNWRIQLALNGTWHSLFLTFHFQAFYVNFFVRFIVHHVISGKFL